MKIEQVNEAIMSGKTVVHTHMGISAKYKITGVITRYSAEKGWTYALELQDKSRSVVIAAIEETEVEE